jgi:hypothetical protein
MVCLPVPPLPHNYYILRSFGEGLLPVHPILQHPDRTHARLGAFQPAQPHKQLPHRLFLRMDVTHRGLNRIVPCHLLQCERVGVLTALGHKRVAQRMQPRNGMGLDPAAHPSHLVLERPVRKRPGAITGGVNT